jgi:hypothetical protein
MTVKDHCECPQEGKLTYAMRGWYDARTELPYVDHKPGECRCTNDLRLYERDGQALTLCSCCVLSSDKEISEEIDPPEATPTKARLVLPQEPINHIFQWWQRNHFNKED